MTRAMNLSALIGLLALSIALAGWPDPAVALRLRQEATGSIAEVGSGPVGDRGFSATGRAFYQAGAVNIFGYLTQINGLDPSLLSTGAAVTEQNALFTFSARLGDASQENRGDVTMFSGDGVFRIFLQEQPESSWSDPGSFAAGQQVAEFSIALHDTLQRQAPGVGVVVGDDALTQTVAGEFTLAGQRYRFGQVGTGQRFRTVGALIADAGQSATVALTGAASVTARKSIAIRLGGTPGPLASPEIASCPALEPWLSQTLAGLSQVQTLGAAFASGDLSTLNADVVSQAAADIDTLGTTLQAGDVPPAAADANLLVGAALETYASGLQAIASAVTTSDAGLLDQGRALLASGVSQIARARDAIAALAETCPAA